jgi:hypothetical protein
MVLRMRIDASNLLLAAQVQTRPAAAVKGIQADGMEPGSAAAKPAASAAKPTMMGMKRLGQQLDIKV